MRVGRMHGSIEVFSRGKYYYCVFIQMCEVGKIYLGPTYCIVGMPTVGETRFGESQSASYVLAPALPIMTSSA